MEQTTDRKEIRRDGETFEFDFHLTKIQTKGYLQDDLSVQVGKVSRFKRPPKF